MELLCLGLNFKTAPLAVRERVAMPAGQVAPALAGLVALPTILEGCLLSTCNRTELYAVATDGTAGLADAAAYLAANRQVDPVALRPHLYAHRGMAVVQHLFRVACGLDSMMLGETQILGQVRDAYLLAADRGAVGKVLHQLLSRATHVGKRAQGQTDIGAGAISISYAAVELAKKVFSSLAGRSALVLGAGETAELTLRHLKAAGIGRVVVANRSPDRARSVAEAWQGETASLDELAGHLAACDVVVASTGAPGIVVSKAQLAEALRLRRGRPMFVFDIAVPRDVDPEAGRLEGLFLYNIDDLQSVVAANLQERAYAAKKVDKIVDDEAAGFRAWWQALEVVPTIRQLRGKVESIRRAELEKALAKLPDLSDRERAVVEAMTVTMVNKILNDPTQRLKGLAGADDSARYLDAVTTLFDLETKAPEAEHG